MVIGGAVIEKDRITIRQATAEDAPEIAEVRGDAIQNVKHKLYDQAVLDKWVGAIGDFVQRLLSNSTNVRIVAETGGKIIGYGELMTTENRLVACYVLSSASGKGVGKAIVAELERIARTQNMNYLRIESSANAEFFYTQCGYHVVERGKHTMPCGAIVDCVKMRKDLK